MLKKMLKIVSVVLALSMALSLFAGCRKTETPSGESTSAAGESAGGTESVANLAEKIEITWWEYPRMNVVDKGNGVYENELAAEFTKLNPNISVKVEMIAFNGGPEKVNVAIATNAMPDLIFDYPGRLIDYASKGVLAPLDDMVKEEDKKDISAAMLNDGMYNGKLYMMPIAASIYCMVVNTTIFKEAGVLDLLPLNKPDRAWTFEEFTKALEGIKGKVKGVYPTALWAGNEQADIVLRLLVQNFGADFMSKELDKVVMNSEEGLKGFEWMKSIYDNGLLAPGAETLKSSDVINLFNNRQIAILPIDTTDVYGSQLKLKAEGKVVEPYELAILPYPSAPGVKSKTELSTIGLSVFDNKDASKVEAAKKLLQYIVTNKEAVASTNAHPARKSMGDLGELRNDNELKFLGTLAEHDTECGVVVVGYSDIRTKWFPNMQALFIGEKSPKQALEDFTAEANKALEEKQK